MKIKKIIVLLVSLVCLISTISILPANACGCLIEFDLNSDVIFETAEKFIHRHFYHSTSDNPNPEVYFYTDVTADEIYAEFGDNPQVINALAFENLAKGNRICTGTIMKVDNSIHLERPELNFDGIVYYESKITVFGDVYSADSEIYGDGIVDILDLIKTRQSVIYNTADQLPEEIFKAMDINQSGTINIGDILWIRSIIVNKAFHPYHKR